MAEHTQPPQNQAHVDAPLSTPGHRESTETAHPTPSTPGPADPPAARNRPPVPDPTSEVCATAIDADIDASANAATPIDLAAEGDGDLGDAIRDLVGDVESRLAKLREMSERSARAVTRAAEEQTRLNALREAIAREARTLDESRVRQTEEFEQARTALARRQQDLVDRETQATSTERELAEQMQAAGERARALEHAESELAARKAVVEQRAREVAEFARRSAAEHEQLQSTMRDVRAQEVAHFQDLLFARANEIAALERRLEASEIARTDLEHQLQATLEELRTTRKELHEALAGITEAIERADHLSSHDVEHAQAIEQLTAELNAARHDAEARSRELAVQARTIEEQNRAIEALAAEREVAAQSHQTEVEGLSTQLNDRKQQIHHLESEIERTKQDAIGLQDRIEVLEAELAGAVDQHDPDDPSTARAPAAGAVAGVGSGAPFDRPAPDADLQDEFNALRADIAQRDQAIVQLSEHIRALQQQVRSTAAPASAGPPNRTDDDATSVAEVYEAKVAELEHENARLRQRLDQLQTAEVVRKAQAADPARRVAQLADKDAHFVARRRRRLERQRQLMADRVSQVRKESRTLKQRLDHVRKIEQQQTQVAETQRFLVATEQRMILRWARARSVTLVFLMVASTLLLGLASYLGAMTFFPATYLAAARIEASPRAGFPLTPEQQASWQQVHEALVFSDAVADNFAERLRQMGGEPFAGSRAEALAFLQESVTVDAPEPGVIELRLITDGRERSRRLLDTLSMATASVANAQQAMRTDHARTVIGREARADMLPVVDQRPMMAGVAFGGAFVLMLTVGGFSFLRLRRSRGLMDDYLDEMAAAAAVTEREPAPLSV